MTLLMDFAEWILIVTKLKSFRLTICIVLLSSPCFSMPMLELKMNVLRIPPRRHLN